MAGNSRFALIGDNILSEDCKDVISDLPFSLPLVIPCGHHGRDVSIPQDGFEFHLRGEGNG